MATPVFREQASPAERRRAQARGCVDTREARAQSFQAELGRVPGVGPVIGDSAEWTNVLNKARQVAATETTVCLLGESGTGKEVVARLIHWASPRKGKPFLAAPGRYPPVEGEHPGDRGDEPRPAQGRRRRDVPRRPLLPPARLRHRDSAAARAKEGHPAVLRRLPARDRPLDRPPTRRSDWRRL